MGLAVANAVGDRVRVAMSTSVFVGCALGRLKGVPLGLPLQVPDSVRLVVLVGVAEAGSLQAIRGRNENGLTNSNS